MRDPLARIQAETLDVLRRYLQSGERVALVDFPSGENAGDSLIYLGEKVYLNRLGVQVGYVCDDFRYEPATLRQRVPEGPILLRGGGNLGDRWLVHQNLREQVIRDFPDRRIIQLPQSVEFIDEGRRAEAQKVFGAHPDLTILARDTRSLDAARATFPDNVVDFCPDAALGVGYLPRLRRPAVEVMMLLRDDSERVLRHYDLGPTTTMEADWGLNRIDVLGLKALRAPDAFARRVPSTRRLAYPFVASAYEANAWLNVHRARRVLAAGQILLTDRLHATILGALTRMPVIALDNVTGKISSIYRDYLKDLPGVHFAETADDAGRFVRQLTS